MRQWVDVGGYSLILWWTIIGGLVMTWWQRRAVRRGSLHSGT